MQRSTGWILMAGVFGVLIGAMVVGCVGSDTVAEVDADLMAHFGGYPGGLVAEVVSARGRYGPVHVALSEDGTPLFVGAGFWTPTQEWVVASGGSCNFH